MPTAAGAAWSQLTSGAQARFLATMSHELRTPLNVVIGFSEAMMRDAGGALTREQSVEYAASINEAGRQLLTLVDVILDVARVEAGQFDLPSDLMDVRTSSPGRGRSKRTALLRPTCRCAPTRPPACRCCGATSAASARPSPTCWATPSSSRPAGGSVRVSARLDDRTGDLLILVSDTGIGIADGDLQRAFEPFVQLDASLARRFPWQRPRPICQPDHRARPWRRSDPEQSAGRWHHRRAPPARQPPRCNAVQPHALIGPLAMTLALSPLATTDRLFFERDDAALDRGTAERIVTER